ncbi:protein kinase [Microcoleus sp. FACHB-1515]|uniref:serine/threonine-protein kinase n=1 Tax=Cyanophyceae TaxID=3028117 RepID=UPI0016837B1B|nr:serine/threonine-protein kinase [Microcoleus sp. FACHB-1515]MBD2091755.1 protein kinase [Microcoleus sp. FACHB-1515]
MICCLNPQCRRPLNLDSATVCQACGAPLVSLRSRYRAIQPLGQGGFGRTYLAVDGDRLNARCVIKQFSPQIQGTKSLEKAIYLFNQEAVRLHELGEHAQIPTLLAYFEQDQYLYLVQQFIEGDNLLQIMRKEGVFGERKIRDVLSDVLPILRFVHSRQVIHRDITPVNILRRQQDDRLMLIDFGVAKLVDDDESSTPGTRIGTEGYSPIEQFRGGRAYPASDLYSLGATCLHLMTDTKPDNLYDPLNGRWIWREHLLQRGTHVSDQLAEILDRMLKDLVAERYQSADEVMRDLNADSFLPASRRFTPTSSPPVSAPPKPPTSRPSIPPTPPIANRPSVPPVVSRLSMPPSRPASRLPSSPPRSTAAERSKDRRCLMILTGHTSWVTGVALSPIAPIAASSSLDDTVRIWNLATGELQHTLSGHTRDVNTIAITPDGTMAISGGDDHQIRCWNLQDATPGRTLSGHARDVNAIAISPNGQILASASEDRSVRIWQLPTGSPLRSLMGTIGMVRAIAISPDSTLLATGGLDQKVKLWNLSNGELVRVLHGHLNAVQSIAFTSDGRHIASSSKDKTLRMWNLQSGELLRTFSGHTREVNAIATSRDGRLLASGSSDTTIKIWNMATGDVFDTLTGHADAVNAIAFTSDSKRLVSASADNTLRVWQVVY